MSICLTVGGAHAQPVTPPRPLSEPTPSWPFGKPHEHDVIVPVVLTVDSEGMVTDAAVEASLGDELDQAALEAARRFTFAPATIDGKPVTAKVRAVVRFRGVAKRAASAGPPPPSEPSADLEPTGSSAPNTQLPEVEQVEIRGERNEPLRSASATTRSAEVIRAAPHRTGGDLLQIVPGVFITQHSGQGKAYQIFYRGFDAIHGQDLEFWVGGAPANDVSNVHGQGYADLHFIMPEVVSKLHVLPGNYSPEQGDFAVAGSIRYDLGYSEPGVTGKQTVGSFGERRIFLAYHPEKADPGTFAGFEAQSTDGFGPGRAASRTSAIAQQVFAVGEDRLRLLASGYAGRFDSPGILRLADIESRNVGRFDTYGLSQGGQSSRWQGVVEYSGGRDGRTWSVTPYVVLRSLRLKQNFTGFLLREAEGDTTQQVNEATTAGFTARYRHSFTWLSQHDGIEAGISARHDWVRQSQRALGAVDGRVLGTTVNANVRALDAAGWLDVSVRPVPRVTVRAGLRVDGLSFTAQDNTSSADTRPGGADPSAFSNQIRPPSPGGEIRSSMGTHVGPRASADFLLHEGVHAVASYGEGFRSPQARSLIDGERTPFTKVRSAEIGLRAATGFASGTLSAFRTALENDLVFDLVTTRNETVPASTRIGAALEYLAKPNPAWMTSGSVTYTRATFSGSDSFYRTGDKLPYVPEIIVRQDVSFSPTVGRLANRSLRAKLGTGLTGMFRRPLPYGLLGHDVFLVDASAELRLQEFGVGLDVYNLFDAHWFDSEYMLSANFARGATARQVPERYVTVGAPRTLLVTFSVFL